MSLLPDEDHDRLLKVLFQIKSDEEDGKPEEKKTMPLGQALKSELKSHRLQKEQNENSPSSTGSNTPVLTPVNDSEPEKPGPTKRKRPRRNPVWKFFDVRDGNAFCQRCPYSTRSVFSTNLKVHLKSHHPDLYHEVITAEYNMLSNAPQAPSSMVPSKREFSQIKWSIVKSIYFSDLQSHSIAKSHPLVGSLLSNSKPVASNLPKIVISKCKLIIFWIHFGLFLISVFGSSLNHFDLFRNYFSAWFLNPSVLPELLNIRKYTCFPKSYKISETLFIWDVKTKIGNLNNEIFCNLNSFLCKECAWYYVLEAINFLNQT